MMIVAVFQLVWLPGCSPRAPRTFSFGGHDSDHAECIGVISRIQRPIWRPDSVVSIGKNRNCA